MTTSEPRRFFIERCLGRGGFGEVYQARMTRGDFETEVAVKLLRADLDPRAQAVARLKDEARMLGLVRHRAIPKVYDFVTLRGRLALIVEFIDGADLDTCLDFATPLPLPAALEVLAEGADALHAGWTAPLREGGGTLQLVHRDLKPSNLRIGRDGSAKLLDYGIAWTEAMERVAGTRTGALIGSPAYMAPERYAGARPHPSADVYSLGCVLYEIVMGIRLFDDVSMRTMAGIALAPERFRPAMHARLADLPWDLDPGVRDLLARTVEFDPEARPAPDTLALELRALARQLPGASLDAWCRSTAWPQPREIDAPFVGEVLLEGSSASQRGAPLRIQAPANTVDVPGEWSTEVEQPTVPPWRPPSTPAQLPDQDEVPKRLTLPTSDRPPYVPESTPDERTATPPPSTAPGDEPSPDEVVTPVEPAPRRPPLAAIALLAFLVAAGATAWLRPAQQAPEPTPTVIIAPTPLATPVPAAIATPIATPAQIAAPPPSASTSPTPVPTPARPTPTPQLAALPTPPPRPMVQVSASPGALAVSASLVSADDVAWTLPAQVPPGRYTLSVAFDGANRQRALEVTVREGEPLRVDCVKKMRSCSVGAP